MNPECRTAGSGHLAIEVVSGQSTATSVWAASPLKLLVPRSRGLSVWACLSSFGGGLVAGDTVALTVDLGKQARCFLTSQASTKVYRNPCDRPCSHHLRAQLGPGSLLALLPDPVQAFSSSRYHQHQTFSLGPESGLVLVDWLCSGRAARGERWAFHSFQSRNEVFLGDTRVLLDSLLLAPDQGPLEHSYRMGRFNCLALAVIIGDPFSVAAARVLQEFAKTPLPRHARLVVSASPLAHGALIRLAAENTEEVAWELQRQLNFLSDFLQDDPWSRKF
jgi:urease accessory protein